MESSRLSLRTRRAAAAVAARASAPAARSAPKARRAAPIATACAVCLEPVANDPLCCPVCRTGACATCYRSYFTGRAQAPACMQLNCGRTFFPEELAAAGLPASYVARCFRDGRRAELLTLDSAHIGATLDVCMPYIRAFENLIAQATKLHAHYLLALRERDAVLTEVVASLNAVSGVEANAENVIRVFENGTLQWTVDHTSLTLNLLSYNYLQRHLISEERVDEVYKFVWVKLLRSYLHVCAADHGAPQYESFTIQKPLDSNEFMAFTKPKFDSVFDAANDRLVLAFRRTKAMHEVIEGLTVNAARLRVWGETVPMEVMPAADAMLPSYANFLSGLYRQNHQVVNQPVGEMLRHLAEFSADTIVADLAEPSGAAYERVYGCVNKMIPVHVGQVSDEMPSTVRQLVNRRLAMGEGGAQRVTVARMVRCTGDACRGVFCAADGVCKVCALTHCVDCHVVRGEDHVCDPDLRATVTAVLSECRSCPRCAAQIARSFGCNTMFCTACRTMFDWETGGALRRYAHNPHLDDLTPEQRRAVARGVGAAADDADAARAVGEARGGQVAPSEEPRRAANDGQCRGIDDPSYFLSFDGMCVRRSDGSPVCWQLMPKDHPMTDVMFKACGFYDEARHYYQLSNDWRTHDTLMIHSFELTNRRARIAYLLGHKLPVVHFRPVERLVRVAADIKLTQYPYFIARPAVPSSEGDYTGTLLNVDAARVKRATKAELAATYSAQLMEAIDAFLACLNDELVVEDEDTMRKMVAAMEATKADFEHRFAAFCPKRKRGAEEAADEDADDE